MSGDLAPRPAPAKPVTEEESAALVQEAFDLEQEIKAKAQTFREATWEVAEALDRFRSIRGWERLGYETLNEFLAQPDVGLSRAQFYKQARMWHDLVEHKKVPIAKLKEADPSKVAAAVPAIMANVVAAEDAIDDIKGLSFRDTQAKYSPSAIQRARNNDDGTSPIDEPLAAETEPQLMRCPMCGTYVPEDRLPPTVPGRAKPVQ